MPRRPVDLSAVFSHSPTLLPLLKKLPPSFLTWQVEAASMAQELVLVLVLYYLHTDCSKAHVQALVLCATLSWHGSRARALLSRYSCIFRSDQLWLLNRPPGTTMHYSRHHLPSSLSHLPMIIFLYKANFPPQRHLFQTCPQGLQDFVGLLV